jgi:hypothetical protein
MSIFQTFKQEIRPLNIETETAKPNFVEATTVEIHSTKDGSPMNFLGDRWKGIANAANTNEVFAIVGKEYKIAQHSEVFELVTDAIRDNSLNADVSILELNDGARIHGKIAFPDLKFDVNGRTITMRMTFDNSYNYTTGVRMIVGALSERNGIVYYIRERFSTFYHRHTKGLDINDITKKVQKGVEVFQNKIQDKFNKYAATNINPAKIEDFINECITDDVIPQTYLKSILEHSRNANNQFDLYSASCEVLTKEMNETSIDRQRELMAKMDDVIASKIEDLK